MLHGIIFIAFALLYVQLPSEGDPGFEAGPIPETEVAAKNEQGCLAPRCSEANRLEAVPVDVPESQLWEFARSRPWLPKTDWRGKVPISRVYYGAELWMIPAPPSEHDAIRSLKDGDESVHRSQRPMRVCSEPDAGSNDRLSILNLGLNGANRWIGQTPETPRKSGI